ncbi:MAG: ABC transporter ATP-binding protein [Lachnospiraceae bacterium]|nr:ABC transporter ATP-binding protein [Lachnospiraceae bacterium]
MESGIAISVDAVSKVYKLYNKPSDRLIDGLGLSRKKRYQEHRALDQVSFSIREGETVGIIGVNGSGKSTILKIITGVLTPTEGTVDVNGRISALLELGAGFNMEYTGMENIYMNGAMLGFSDQEIDQRLPEILRFADIGEFVNQPVKTYSSGMFVRLAFAVAINIDPEILIVDEALSVGDVFFQAKCYHKFEEFKKQGKTILFVSHDLSSISKYCDRVIVLNQGKKLEEGKPKEMVDLYKRLLVHQEGEPPAGGAEPHVGAWKDCIEVNPNLLEYGEKQAEIIDFAVADKSGILTNTIEKGSLCTFKIRIRFHQELQEPIAAFTIKDMKGTEITGTNTMYEKIEVPAKAGTAVEVDFIQKMDLQGGSYLLSFGCTGYLEGEFRVFHRLYDACSVTVVSGKDTVGFYDMNSTVQVKES